MRKVKLLAITLVISIMLMGTGYAAWKSSADIKTNANTGSFSVSLEADNSGTKTYKSDTSLIEANEDNFYAKVEYEKYPDSQELKSINFKDLYPGSTAIAHIKVTNSSTLPIKYDRVTFNISGTNASSLLSSKMLQIYAEINNIEYQLEINDYLANGSVINGNVINLIDNHHIDIPGGQNISDIKIKVVVSSSVTDGLGNDLKINLTPSFKQYNS